MPALAIIESSALNAFASGIDRKSYTITVTTGLIETLNAEEIEAVLAHELTHILNEDVRLLIIGIIFVGIISTVSDSLARKLLRGTRIRSGNKNTAALVIGLALVTIGYMLGILVRFSLSRHREYLADAGAVELTKNPEALIQALQKISGNDKIGGLSDEIATMCIENLHTGFFSIFATHPPIEKRIAALRQVTSSPGLGE